MSFYTYTTATTFLEHASSSSDPITLPLETDSPAVPELDSSSTLAQAEHALSSSTFFPADRASAGFVLCRIIEDGYVLELRWVAFSQGAPGATHRFAELDQQSTLPPVRFVFPARLVPTPAFSFADDTGTLKVLALTEAGYLYVLAFSGPSLFYSAAQGAEYQRYELAVAGLATRFPVLMHGVDERTVVIGCAEGYVLSVDIDEDSAVLNETELRSGNSFFTRALIPSFSTRNLSSSSHASSTTSAPSQILSVASYQSDAGPSYAFGVTRDRKLKFWNLDSGICIKATDLPKPSYNPDSGLELEMARSRELESPGGATPVRGKAPILLSPTPQPFLKIVQGDEDSSFPSYLVLYVPAAGGNPPAFHIYGIATNTSGVVSELVAVTERICPMNAATLVDFEASPFGPDDSASQGWTLWTLWQEGGESEIRFVDLQELSAEGESSDVVEWTTVDRGTTSVAVWNAGHFDELLRDSSKSVAQVFIHHLGYPGRYPPATLAYALAHYEDTLLYETDPHHRPAVLSLEHNSAFERICAIVGCTVQLEMSPQTGALLHDAHNQRLKVEWLRFIALCNESRAAALFPVVLAVCPERRVAIVVMRDAVAVPIVQDTILTLRQLAAPETRDDDKAQSFLNLPSELLQLSYPHFAPRGIRHDVFAIFTAIATLTQGMSPESSRGLEAELCGRARTMFTHNMEETSIEIYERVLEPFIDDTLRESLAEQMRDLVTPEAAFVALWTALTTSELVQPLPSSAAMSATSDLTSALLTDSLAAAIEARYTTALGLVVLLIYIYGEEQDLVPHIASLTSSSFATLHTLSSLRWIMQQSSSPSSTHSPPNDEGILERFGDMRVSNFDDPNAVVPFSLLNRLLRHEYSPLLAVDATLPQAVTSAMCSFLQLTGLITHKRIFVDTPAAVLFARRVQQMGLPALALEFVGMQGKGPGMSYVAGLAQLDLGSTVEAEASFLNEMSGACKSNHGGKPYFRLDDASGLTPVLPLDISGSLARYYRHIVSLFVDRHVNIAIIHCAALALDAFDEEEIEDETATKDLWLKLFMSQAALERYDDAYDTLMSIPHPETRSNCLGHFISVVCESDNVSLLSRCSFVGLQSELERNLAFRARNADPFSSPNYYAVFYSYLIANGDFRSAAAAVFQQGRRVGELAERGGNNLSDAAMLQCHSYLSTVETLRLVDPKDAWISVPVDRISDKKGFMYQIPEADFDPSAKRVDIVTLQEVQKDYAIALARLQLSSSFPEFGQTNFVLEPDVVVALLVQTSQFDLAFSAALTLDVDMSSLLEQVTEKCAELSYQGAASDDDRWVIMNDDAATWAGSLVSKAWKLLQSHLERHDDETCRYKLVVLEKILSLNQAAKIPSWLVSSLLAKDPAMIVRTMIKYNRLADAFEYSLSTIQKQIKVVSDATPQAPITPGTMLLPYSLFDHLLSLSPDNTPSPSPPILASYQVALRTALEMSWVGLEGVQTSWEKPGR